MNVNILVPTIEKFHRSSQTENYNFFRKLFNDFCQIIVMYGERLPDPSCLGGIFRKIIALSVYGEVCAVSLHRVILLFSVLPFRCMLGQV
jgi:hypothetical protein